MTVKDEQEKESKYAGYEGMKFLVSMRGRYIVAQALFHALRHLESVPSPWKEVSNIDDMRFLQETLFNFPDDIFEYDIPKVGKDGKILVDEDTEVASV